SSDGRVGDATETTIPELQLSAPQLGIWIDWVIDPAGTNYNMSEYLEIFGAVDVTAFERALRVAVREAEALNVRIVERPEGPRQIRKDLTDWPMPVVDFSASADPRAAAKTWMRGELDGPVDPRHDPLFAYALVKIGPDRWFWYARNHHLVMD